MKTKAKPPVARHTKTKKTTPPAAPPAAIAVPQPTVPPASTTPPTPPTTTVAGSRRNVTPAQKRGSELVRFLRLHAKRPFATRGENAIVALAREVGHLGRVELDNAKAGA